MIIIRLLIFGFICLLTHTSVLAQGSTLDSIKSLYNKSTDEKDKTILLSKIGFYTITSNPDSALILANKALKQSQILKFEDGEASSLNTIGWVHFQKGEYNKAIDFIQKSLNIYLKNGNENGVFTSYFNISSIYIKQGAYPEALKYLLKTLPLIEKFPTHEQVTGIYKNLGIVYREMDDYEKAIDYFNRAIQINVKNNNLHLAADIKTSLGILYSQMGRPADALREYESAYRIYKKENNLQSQSLIRENEGDLYYNLEDYTKALDLFLEAKKGYERLGSLPDLAYISMEIAKVQTAQKKYDLAIQTLKEGLEFSSQTNAKNYELNLHQQLAETYEAAQYFDLALKSYKDYQILKDSIQSDNQVSQLSRLRTEFETEQKDQQIRLLNTEKSLQKAESFRRLLIAVAFALLVILLAGFIYVRTKLFKKEKLLAEHKQQETEQKLLRSQMNPHFIFNCFNTIDSYVLQNRKLEASRLIQRFSKLTRLVLEQSAQEEITVKESMDMLRTYLQIEQTRNNNKFGFDIEVDESTASYRVAPMLIQPFVENSIIHGIKNKDDENGFISVKIKEDIENLIFEVEDNGVGRKRATAIKKETNKTHHSMAMDITLSRLSLLNKGKDIEDYIKFTDIEGENTGTRIEVSIPKKL